MFGPMGIVAPLYERVNWLEQEAVHLRGSVCEEIYLHCPTEITAEWLVLLLYIQDVLGSKFSPESLYHDYFCGFPESLQAVP
jgi:hypothetical protein